MTGKNLSEKGIGMIMQPATTATLRYLDAAPWFSRVGMAESGSHPLVLKSWPDAVEHVCSDAYRDLNTAAANRFGDKVLARSRDRYDKLWEICDELEKCTIPLVCYKIEPVVRKHKLPDCLQDKIGIDILHACLEAEYADLVKPGWFTGLSYWYVKGHFPCGWEGTHPDGRLIVY
jgi:hypothetical protein